MAGSKSNTPATTTLPPPKTVATNTTTSVPPTPTVPITPSAPATTATPITSPPSPSQPAGWQSLFNGNDLTGWSAKGFNGWSVVGGVLIGETNGPHGWLMTDAEYGDFELELEYKLASNSNSGVFLRAWPDANVSGADFHEIQLLDNAAPKNASLPANVKNASLYKYLAAQPPADGPVNTWHRMRITVFGLRIRVMFNDKLVVDGSMPGGKASKGHIGLQLYPTHVEFRNLRVRSLNVDGTPLAATDPAPVANAPATLPGGWQALFSGSDLTGWTGKPGVWKLASGELTGTLPGKDATFLWSDTQHKDFELAFQVRLTGAVNSGVQFRSAVLETATFLLTGPQCEIGGTGKTGYGGLWWEKGPRNGVVSAVQPEKFQKLIKPDDFNDMTLRCVGNHVTILLNGTTTIDGDYDIPYNGLLGFQLVSQGPPATATFRNLRIRSLTK